MEEIKLTLDCGDPIKMKVGDIKNIDSAISPDGRSYTRIEYHGDPRKKTKFYAIKESVKKVKSLIKQS